VASDRLRAHRAVQPPASETMARLHEPLDIPDLALAMLAGPAALIAVLAEAVSELDQLIADGSSDPPPLSDTVDFWNADPLLRRTRCGRPSPTSPHRPRNCWPPGCALLPPTGPHSRRPSCCLGRTTKPGGSRRPPIEFPSSTCSCWSAGGTGDRACGASGVPIVALLRLPIVLPPRLLPAPLNAL
jgi:hypothetical protein